MGSPLPKTPIRLLAFAGIITVLFSAACSTPQSRIEKDPALYASFPADVQENVKAGKIAIGYTPDMVTIAWGKPDTTKEIIDDKGRREVWIYLATRQVFDGYDSVQVPRPAVNGQAGGFYIEQRPRFRTEYYDRGKVTFTDGKVSKIVQ